MSYCRFSCDNWKCDLYVYSDFQGGWTIHIAKRRHSEGIPEVPPLPRDKDDIQKWMAKYQEQMDWLQADVPTIIDLPHAGKSFYSLDKEQTLATLKELKSLGYNFPDYVIDNIASEEDEDEVQAGSTG